MAARDMRPHTARTGRNIRQSLHFPRRDERQAVQGLEGRAEGQFAVYSCQCVDTKGACRQVPYGPFMTMTGLIWPAKETIAAPAGGVASPCGRGWSA